MSTGGRQTSSGPATSTGSAPRSGLPKWSVAVGVVGGLVGSVATKLLGG